MRYTLLFLSALLAAATGCSREASTTPAQPAAKGLSQPGAANTSAVAVARIVFVDQERCCACTRDRVNTTWKALTDVVGYPPVPDVERIHMDSQADRAATYIKQRAIMVPPAIYFLDARGKLVQMLQGEVKSEEIRKVLGS